MIELTFEGGVKGPLDTRRKTYFDSHFKKDKNSKTDDENRASLLMAIGNTAMLVFSENEKLCEDFLNWIIETRGLYQIKLSEMEQKE